MSDVKVWTDHVGLYHAAVPMTGDERIDFSAAVSAIHEHMIERNFLGVVVAYRLMQVERTLVKNHGVAIYSEILSP